MEGEKPWYRSVTLMGALVTILSPLIGALFHVTLGVEETNKIAVYLVGIADAIGGLIAIYGRVMSTKRITTPKIVKQIRRLG